MYYWVMRQILLSCLLITCCLGCPRPASLPAQPQLVSDDLGIGLYLLMDRNEAQALSGKQDNMEIKVLSTDNKQQIKGYDISSTSDEVVALYFDAVPGVDDDETLSGRISEIRCFLNTGSASGLRLLGRPVADLGADDMEQMLGKPRDRSQPGDGQIHLTYLFDPQVPGANLQLRLVTSHHLDHSCYAFAMSLINRD